VDAVKITVDLVEQLIQSQFPRWARLPVTAIKPGGWDNRTFRLGDDLLARLPSAAAYAPSVEREQRWLPILAPKLSQPIPLPVAMGRPSPGYPWNWSIYRWLKGEPAWPERIAGLEHFAADLAAFLCSLQAVVPDGGPVSGPDTFHRGGHLAIYDQQTRKAIDILKPRLGRRAASALAAWEEALATQPPVQAVWVHGDISVGNLLVNDGQLCGVIDFGQFCVGDPACDLAIAWTLFDEGARSVFRSTLAPDEGTWIRGRAWALWKALIIASSPTRTKAWESTHCWNTIDRALGRTASS
jgi:aminoglycoside phosphotransferase (APT) family kinase protein